MLCIRCGKEIPITCKELAFISMDGNPYSYMPLCDLCYKAFINFINNKEAEKDEQSRNDN